MRIVRFISKLRTSLTQIKDILCAKHVSIIKRDHKIEKEELNEDIWSFSDEPKNTFMDKKFVYNTYKLMTLEIEHPDYFMVINSKNVKYSKTTKLQQVLDAQKKETLSSILSLITAIHNMDNADDFESILDKANYYVLFDKQNKQLKELIEKEDEERFKGIAGLLNDTFYYIVNKEKIVKMSRWYDSCRSRLSAIKILVKLHDEIESGRFNNITLVASVLYSFSYISIDQ